MWCFYAANEAMELKEMYAFETKEEALKFFAKVTINSIERHPNHPELWININDDDIFLFEVKPTTAEKAFQDWSEPWTEV